MNIQESIAATLKTVREERNLTLAEFSDEIGIARTSRQGYLKENSNPRADSIELLSEKPNIPATVLISGPDADSLNLGAVIKMNCIPYFCPCCSGVSMLQRKSIGCLQNCPNRKWWKAVTRHEQSCAEGA